MNDPEFLTVPEAASVLRVSTKTIYEAVRDKRLPGAIRIGGQIRINRTVFFAWLNDSAVWRAFAAAVTKPGPAGGSS